MSFYSVSQDKELYDLDKMQKLYNHTAEMPAKTSANELLHLPSQPCTPSAACDALLTKLRSGPHLLVSVSINPNSALSLIFVV